MASNDLFNKMLGVNSASSNSTDENNDGDVVVKREENAEELQSEEREVVCSTDNTENEGTEKKTQETNESDSADSLPAYVPISGDIDEHEEKDKKNLKDITSRINFKKYGIIAAIALVVIIAAYLGLGVFLPATSNASKIKKDFLIDEIGTVYSAKIEGSALKEKIFKNGLSDYPEKIKEAFISGRLSENDAKKALDQLNKYSLCEGAEISEKKEFITNLSSSKEAFEKGNKYYDSGEYEKAIVEYSKVVADDENYETAKSKIKECSDKYKKSVLDSANFLILNDNYQDAMSILSEASDILKNDMEVSSALEKAKTEYALFLKTKALNEGNEFLSKQDYAKAFEVIENAKKYNSNDSDLNALYTLCVSEFENNTIEKVEKYITEFDYNLALDCLEKALVLLPDNSKILQKKIEVESKKPVSLSSTTLINSENWTWNQGNPMDPFGNDYSESENYMICKGWIYWGTYGEFRIYEKYSNLSGQIAPYTTIGEHEECYIQIYADDELVYTSPTITRKTDAFKFNVNVKNADYVKIVLYPSNGDCNIILSNLMLHNF